MISIKSLLLFAVSICILILIVFLNVIVMNHDLWRDPGQRDTYIYNVHVKGLSGRHVDGITTIMVPVPATNEGKFATAYSQKEPSFFQDIVNRYILQLPDRYRTGPYFKNTTEKLDNISIDNRKWTSSIIETEEGYMLEFESNDSVLEDLDFIAEVTVEDIDIFDPINGGSPILYPAHDFSEISTKPYGEQVRYDSTVNYWTYVYLSDNIEAGTKSIEVTVDAHNDPTEWEEEYRGRYMVTVSGDVEGAGKIEVVANLEQEFWFPCG